MSQGERAKTAWGTGCFTAVKHKGSKTTPLRKNTPVKLFYKFNTT